MRVNITTAMIIGRRPCTIILTNVNPLTEDIPASIQRIKQAYKTGTYITHVYKSKTI